MSVIAFLAVLMVGAHPVTESEARQKALRFMQGRQVTATTVSRAKAMATANAEPAPLYIYNVENDGGFVIVSGDDATVDVLAYGTAGDVTLSNGDAQVTLYYAPNGNIAKITDNVSGKVYSYTYNANGAFVSGRDSDGNALTAQFTFAGEIIDVRYTGIDFSSLTFNAVYNTNVNTNHYSVDGITYYKTDKDGNILRENDTADEYYVAGYDASGKLVSYEYLKDGVTTTYYVADIT